jgi:hypothetical protein
MVVSAVPAILSAKVCIALPFPSIRLKSVVVRRGFIEKLGVLHRSCPYEQLRIFSLPK